MNTPLQRILHYAQPYWKRLVLSIICATLFGITSSAPAYLLKHTIDDIFIKQFHHLIIPFIGAFILFFALKGLFMYLSSYFMHWVGNKVVNDIRSSLLEKIIHFPLSFYQKTTTGHLMSHFLNDVQMIQATASNVIKDGVRSVFEALCLIIIAFYQNWQLTALTLLVGPFIGITISIMSKARKKASRAIQQEMGRVSNMLQESFVGIREIKAFNAENTEVQQFKHLLKNCFSSIMKNAKIEALAPACVEVIAMTGGGIVFFIATQQILKGSITAGQLTSFAAAIILAFQPLKKIINIFGDIQYGTAAAERIFTLMDEIAPTALYKTKDLTPPIKTLCFEQVGFSYNDHSTVFENATFTIEQGSCVGIVGPSGSGKSTLCDLLLGFIHPTHGTITINALDLVDISYQSLRNRIGYVGQRPFLFNDTIYNNIAYANPQATHADVIRACTAAYAHNFIEQLPQGYNTIVGENGACLSGGQKQRITIARALLKNPDIIIFDEATSSLDHESEQFIQQTINELKGVKTLFIVSHRPTILHNVDIMLTVNNKTVTVTQPQMPYVSADSGPAITTL